MYFKINDEYAYITNYK